MAKNRTPKGMVAIRTHDGDVTKVTYAPAPSKKGAVSTTTLINVVGVV